MRTSSDLVADFKRDHADIYKYVDDFFNSDFSVDDQILMEFKEMFNIYDLDVECESFIFSVAEAFVDYLKFYDLNFGDENALLVCMLRDLQKRKIKDYYFFDQEDEDLEADTACNLRLSVSDATLSKFDQLREFLKKDYEDDGILVFPFDNDFAFDVMIEMLYSHFIDKSDIDLLEEYSEGVNF